MTQTRPRLPIVVERDGGTLGEVVRRVREGRGMTMDDLAAACGVGKATLSVIENDTCDPRLGTLMRLADGLRIPLYGLIGHACGQYAENQKQRPT